MEYFSRGFKSVLGGQGETGNAPSGTETIERLCDRIGSAQLLEDRRDAVKAIKSLSKKYRLDVGTLAMTLLVGVLQKDRNDAEICGLALEALINVLSSEGDEETDPSSNMTSEELALQFTEIFLKDAENVTTLLSLLEEYDFRVRWPTVKLLTILLKSRAIQIQQCILVSPLGVSRLMDLLSDSREVIRNDGLLLLIQLTKGNAAIQKIVAFENAFDRLLEVISEEGYSDGGIVVEDCLSLLSNLFNASNINFFREGSYIQKLVPYFDFTEYTTEGRSWNEQKVNNVLMMLKLVRLLVSPSNPPQSTQSSQKIIHNCNLLKVLCDILMTTGIPAEILTETVNTVAEIIRGNQTNQGFFSVVNAPYSPPKPAIVVLLMSMISDKQPFLLRCAVLYCFQCYLYKNATGQSRIISTLLPSSAEASNVTAGQLLCGGLFSADSFSNWCAAIALSHSLIGNKELKEQLLRVQLATGVDSQPVSLLQQCSNILSNGGSTVQTKIAMLSLLCNWLSNCPVAVNHYLRNSAVIPFLLACVEQPCESYETIIQGLSAALIGVCIVYNDNEIEAFTTDAIKRLITTRFDPEHFQAKINDITKTESFTSAAKHTQLQEEESDKVLFDHEFTKQFKKFEVSIARAFSDDDEGEDKTKTNQANDAALLQYKELIRQQDEELTSLRQNYQHLQESYNQAIHQVEQQAIDIVDLRSKCASNSTTSSPQPDNLSQNFQQQINALQEQLRNKDTEIAQLQIIHSSFSNFNLSTPPASSHDDDNRSLEEEITSLKESVTHFQQENEQLTAKLSTMENKLKVTEASLEVITSSNTIKEDEFEALKQRVTTLQQENENIKSSSQTLTTDPNLITQLRADLQQKTEDYDQQKQDYEDLLVLLEDQDSRIKKLKERLRSLGENIADESTDEDDDADDILIENGTNEEQISISIG